ncbi:MoaD/ThiS family protein [Acetobacter conturbans]|uniref:Molybdopterin synthase sulfur carrier subunit n=1 Tax=Acetobacter conturbans TaxID=1737472 RepID=A0ABX0JZY8_9PROT|nr:MoaD/ThiS family protein [Acetobacter conturbans]NHN87352.1 molybdopterin synthase sulfur carrier subunit [Acetobacter conturbans]
MSGTATILYFAALRERIGRGSETVPLTADVSTVGDLLAERRRQDETLEDVFAQPGRVRVAVNRVLGDLSTPVHAGDEVAFFPPMTGG